MKEKNFKMAANTRKLIVKQTTAAYQARGAACRLVKEANVEGYLENGWEYAVDEESGCSIGVGSAGSEKLFLLAKIQQNQSEAEKPKAEKPKAEKAKQAKGE